MGKQRVLCVRLIEAAVIRHKEFYSVNFLRIAFRFDNINGFRIPLRFLWKGFIVFFLHDALHLGISQRTQKSILYWILDI